MPTGFSPSLTSPSRELGHGPPQRTRLETTIRQPEAGDLQVGLFPVHSPLLGESWLVSFPPLIDMLKFSGCSCLNSGRKCKSASWFEGNISRAKPTSKYVAVML